MVGKALGSLRENRPFRLLWFSNLFFFGGVWTQTLVLGWLAYETTRSDLLVAVFAAARLAPLLLGPFAGAVADRHNRVRLLVIACSWALVTGSGVAALTSLDKAPYWVLLVGGLAVGLAQSPSQPARASLVLDLVGRQNLSNANALNSMALNMTQVVGPAIGGLMISGLGAAAALWISTVWSAIMPVFAQESLGLDAAGLGWLLTCGGIGGLLGSVVIAALGDFRWKGAMFLVGTACWGTLWSMFALSTNPATSFVLMGGIGVLSAAFGVLQTTLLLMTTDPHLHGRALGVQELAIGIMPLASLALGALANHYGVALTTFASALLLVASTLTLAARTPQLLRYGV